jgi:beta-ribofuranosylaminobenzene 5'-phosphate synthase
MILVRGYPRLHVSLLDLGHVTRRRYGGGGFAIDCNPVEVSAAPREQYGVDGLDLIDDAAVRDIRRVLSAFKSMRPNAPPFHICIRRVPAQHAGFGTKTALLLTVLAAANCVTESGLEVADLKLLSGRGGTSGVGINLFFTGGFICDLGHPDRSDELFEPSSASRPTEIPPVACRFDTPSVWRFLLILPAGKRLSGLDEQLFFDRATPLSRIEVLESIGAMYHGVVPAVVSADIALLSSSLNVIHSVGFKRRELDAQSEAVKRTYHLLRGVSGLATGLSSLGPLIYAVMNNDDLRSFEAATAVCIKEGARCLGAFPARNSGSEIAYE